MKAKRKTKIRKDEKGEYILESYFVRGKQRFRRIYVVDGIPTDEFYRNNADPITLLLDEEFELLNDRYTERQ